MRRAVGLALLTAEGQRTGEWFAERGGPIDIYGPPPPLPRYLTPEDVVEQDADE